MRRQHGQVTGTILVQSKHWAGQTPRAVEVSDDIVVLRDPRSSQAADMRRLAQTLALRLFDGGPDHIALSIISADRHEGRSTVAVNLACIFASAGISSLLIDGDMHNPSIHHKFGLLHTERGAFTDQPVAGLKDLHVLPAAELAELQSDMFMHNVIGSIIARKRNQHRIIIVDTPAAALSNDYQVAALATKCALVVTREGLTKARKTVRMLNSCDDAGIVIIGGVMLKAR